MMKTTKNYTAVSATGHVLDFSTVKEAHDWAAKIGPKSTGGFISVYRKKTGVAGHGELRGSYVFTKVGWIKGPTRDCIVRAGKPKKYNVRKVV